MNLYELVTTENVDVNYKSFEKDELINCISNLSDTYFRLKMENERVEQLQQENQKLKYNWNKLRETLKNEQLGRILYSDKKRFAYIDEILLKMQELEKGE